MKLYLCWLKPPWYLVYVPAVLVLLLSPVGCRQYKQEIAAYLDAAHQLWGFDGAVMISRNGRVLFRQGYGLADRQFNQVNTPQTRFFIGSITKQFTAAAVLALHEQGLLDVDDPITRYLPDYPRDPGDRITIYHLLTHTSGIPNYTDDLGILFRRTEAMTPEDIIAAFQQRPLDFEPGTDFRYSNSGYVLLGRIIETVSEQSYEACLHRRLFGPAGMHDTGYGRRGIPDRAAGYTPLESGRVVDALPVDYSILFSSGALYSTVEDMARWDHALYAHTVLRSASISAMFTPHKDNYGYGWVIESRFDRRLAHHGGFLDGFNTTFDRWLDDTLCIVVFSNEDEAPVNKIALGLAAIIFGERYVMPVQKTPAHLIPSDFAEYAGAYQTDGKVYYSIDFEQDTLTVHQLGVPRQRLYPQARDTFFFSADNTKLIIFTRDTVGVIDACAIMDDGHNISANRLTGSEALDAEINRTVVALDSTVLIQYAGRYDFASDAGRSEFALTVGVLGGHLAVSGMGAEPIEIFPGSETRFFHKSADLQITFIGDEDGSVTSCLIRVGPLTARGRRIIESNPSNQ